MKKNAPKLKPTADTGKIIIPANAHPWPHELRVAKILAQTGHTVEFIPKSNIKTADILLDGIVYEIKSPRSFKTNSLEHIVKGALRQSPNIIIDASYLKNCQTQRLHNFLSTQARMRKQIKKVIFITKTDKIIDITSLP